MAENPISRRESYVYALYQRDGATPFYIGIGTGKRWLIHERDAKRGVSRKDRIIAKMQIDGFSEIPKRKLISGLTRIEAASIEVALIAAIGRSPNGPLVNHTRGGDGAGDLSEEARAKKSSRNKASWLDPEVRRKRSAGIRASWTAEKKAQYMTDERRKKLILASAAAALAAARKRLVAGSRTPRPKRDRSASLKAYWAKPGVKEQRKPRSLSKDHLEKLRNLMTTAEMRAKLDAGNVRVRERRIAAQRAAFSSPEARLRRSVASKKMWAAKRPAGNNAQYALPLPNETASQP